MFATWVFDPNMPPGTVFEAVVQCPNGRWYEPIALQEIPVNLVHSKLVRWLRPHPDPQAAQIFEVDAAIWMAQQVTATDEQPSLWVTAWHRIMAAGGYPHAMLVVTPHDPDPGWYWTPDIDALYATSKEQWQRLVGNGWLFANHAFMATEHLRPSYCHPSLQMLEVFTTGGHRLLPNKNHPEGRPLPSVGELLRWNG